MDRLDGARTLAVAADVNALYQVCYSAPPWSETPEQLAAYGGQLAGATGRPGFTALTIRDHDRLLGICYGWPTPEDLSGNTIYDGIIEAYGAARAIALTQGAFEVAELFVHPDAQGQGLGRRLLRAMVAGRPTAWLITSPQTPAARLYRTLGWQEEGPLPADLYPQLRLSVFTSPSAEVRRHYGARSR
ncbi:GNAT family N-acetyltransferase [Streptosporangium sp. 'caverna']|uniref:GNAT family N-acetyltransferase n=1 Tax=Streptosporangium sp. 'caverna' TaxID=2202249 RepID=UPI000D7DC789|nr:GNAT family N-acetyltransferase [Streptosporangium sp. 'caverna']AWS43868.1 GNAT family N-acetyltransferase [Streptosporangium sp. 'caverna']